MKAKDAAVELIRKLIPHVYCFMGSGMLANWVDPDVALGHAKDVCRILTPDNMLLSNINELTKEDVWTEDELKNMNA